MILFTSISFMCCNFKLMNMMCDRRQHFLKWESHLCSQTHKKIQDTLEESRCLVVGSSNGEQFEATLSIYERENALVNSRKCKDYHVSYMCIHDVDRYQC